MPNKLHYGSVRLTSGLMHGRKISFPPNLCHPMSERARQPLFQRLCYNLGLHWDNVLDLFAGSGSLGFECLSGGAGFVTFVDKNPKLIHAIEKNLETFTNPYTSRDHALPIVSDVYKFCEKHARRYKDDPDSQYDVIFADPPYDDLQLDFLKFIPDLLRPDGVFALSIPAKMDPPEIEGLKCFDHRTYAGCHHCLYDHDDYDPYALHSIADIDNLFQL